jgi:hypothetical protein
MEVLKISVISKSTNTNEYCIFCCCNGISVKVRQPVGH